MFCQQKLLNNQTSNFETSLAESSDICSHHKIFKHLWQVYEIQNNLAPPIIGTMFEIKKLFHII